jgi:hypothetical protein
MSFRIVLAIAGLAAALVLAPAGQTTPTEIFFSEYIEGSSHNKALEIFNGTGTAIDLATGGYSVRMFFNGNNVSTLRIDLTGTIASGDVYVVAQALATGTILAQADQTNGRLVQRRRRGRPLQGGDHGHGNGVGERAHEHRRQHAPAEVDDRGRRRGRIGRIRPVRRVGRLRDRHVRRARGALGAAVARERSDRDRDEPREQRDERLDELRRDGHVQ